MVFRLHLQKQAEKTSGKRKKQAEKQKKGVRIGSFFCTVGYFLTCSH